MGRKGMCLLLALCCLTVLSGCSGKREEDRQPAPTLPPAESYHIAPDRDEVISEGEGMKRYLMRRGISEDRIIVEDKSTSTYENIKNAFEITDAMGLSRDITIATSEYHLYRASLIAKSPGAGEVTSIPSFTDFNLVPAYWVREWLGISHFFVFGT